MQKIEDWEGVKTVENPPPAARPTPEAPILLAVSLALDR
jgi:hypothetical protein